MERLTKRAEYVAVAQKGTRIGRRGFLLQARADAAGPERRPRFGFTVTKKTGNAVVRNRIRRRLREAVRIAAPLHAAPSTDYVLVGRRPALDMAFARLVADLAEGLAEASRPRKRAGMAAGTGAGMRAAAPDSSEGSDG